VRIRLFWRVFLVNAALLAAGTLILALAPVTISAPIALTEAIVLSVGLLIMLVANLLLLRALFGPLERLTRRMHQVDVLRRGERVAVSSRGEIGELEEAFNDMLERLETERREAGLRTARAQNAERRRIARELHDEVGQTMTGVLFQLKRLGEHIPEDRSAELAEAQAAVRTCLEEVRRISRELRPEVLDDLGLASALTELATTFSRRTGITVRRRLEADLPPFDRDLELALYRVAQESLTNVARHADASEVVLSLERSDGHVTLRVQDDGRGVDGDAVEGGGLRGIREHALIVGGTLTIGSGPGGGLEIALEAPIAPAQEPSQR
jgi:two-component system sensor histidine kinase UhpB